MAYDLSDRLVVGVASSALFDLTESDLVFRREGEAAYRAHQRDHATDILAPGVAFGFVRRLLGLNDLGPADDPPVEVIVLSRNDPETGLRVMRSIAHHGLPITRAVFMQGRSPFAFMPALSMSLFLSANGDDVREAVDRGLPAGRVVGTPVADGAGHDLRVAFDFDGVLADDGSERVMRTGGLERFQDHEHANAAVPMGAGPLRGFLAGLRRIQEREDRLGEREPGYNRRLHLAIVTARSAPSHERVVHTLNAWGLRVNDAFFLGGIEKALVLETLRPHIFFDDQTTHVEPAARLVPSVHIPFGVANALPPPLADPAEPGEG